MLCHSLRVKLRLSARARQGRERRVNAMWARFWSLLGGDGFEHSITDPAARLSFLRSELLNGRRPAGWWFANSLEVADLNLHYLPTKFQPRPAAAAVSVRPGSRRKVAALARRAAKGEELWHAEDGTPEMRED